MKPLLLTALLLIFTTGASAQSGLRVSWYGAVETVSRERVVIKNDEGRFSVSKQLIREVKGSDTPRAGEYFELEMPLRTYLGKIEKSRDLYLVKELGRMPASVPSGEPDPKKSP